ncbi:MAG TPA: hypothetical protein VN541_10830 [Tepidisphaeraceae bacterium]|nr:hypothetical protein [Tepidisphaeraceae bacterium]
MASTGQTTDLDTILASLRKEFADSGVSDEESIEQINEARDEYHRSRKANGTK